MKITWQKLIGKENDYFRIQEYIIEYSPNENEIECSICGKVSSYIWQVFHKRSFLVEIYWCEKCFQEIKNLIKIKGVK